MEITKATPEWQLTMLQLTIIYRVLECGEKIPLLTETTSYEFVNKLLDGMHNQGLLEISDDNQYWVAGKKGEELRNRMVEIFDHTIKFEIFASVAVALTPDDSITDEDGNVMDHCYDPRFGPFDKASQAWKDENGVEDMRIAMIRYLSEYTSENDDNGQAQPIDPHQIVFMQMLAEGKLKGDIWFDLRMGTFFEEVSKIVESAYQWTDCGDDEEDSAAAMQQIYTAGMLEQRKRDGYECSACHIPLAIFEFNAHENNETLEQCPNPECGASYNPPEPEGGGYECPKCGSTVGTTQRACGGCGALLDFSLPEGTVVTETVTEEVTEYEDETYDCWGGYYGYEPYGWYDPYDPYLDTLVFCAAVGAVGAACYYW